MRYFAHRGARKESSENTLSAFSRALELGATWLEFDVQRCKDALVVIHDETLERTTNGHGFVKDYSYTKLSKLNAGQGERIPRLEEVFELVDKRAGLNIELKSDGCVEGVLDCIDFYTQKGWRYDQILVSSFHHDWLRECRQANPLIPIAALWEEVPSDYAEISKDLGAVSVHTSAKSVNPTFVADAHARGLRVYVYTVNDVLVVHELEKMGVDGIFTDDIAAFTAKM